MTEQIITQAQLKEYIHYSPLTGVFTRISSPYEAKLGVINSCANHSNGYFQIGISGKLYKAHRLAWMYMHGEWPKDQIDHINRDKIDNRIDNLREASSAQNNQNVGLRSDNASGIKGVTYYKITGKWVAKINISGKLKHIGYFKTLEEASQAYESYAKQHHGEFYYKNVA